jgi:hypothetical protein
MITLDRYYRLLICALGIFLAGQACAMPIVDIDPTAYFTVREHSNGARELDEGNNVPGFRGFISNVSIFSDKTFMEFGLTGPLPDFDSVFLAFMTSGGTNVTRTVNIGWYEADGVASADDFDIVPVMIASFTQDEGIPQLFQIDVTAAIEAALLQFGTIGFVFEMETAGAQTFLSSAPAHLRVVPAPATAMLLLAGCVGLIASRRFFRAAERMPKLG